LKTLWYGFVGLRRIVTVAFLRRVQIFLLTYLLTYFASISYLLLWTDIRLTLESGAHNFQTARLL